MKDGNRLKIGGEEIVQKIELNVDRNWLARNARGDEGTFVSVGGLASKLGLVETARHAAQVSQTTFGRLIELRRREIGIEH